MVCNYPQSLNQDGMRSGRLLGVTVNSSNIVAYYDSYFELVLGNTVDILLALDPQAKNMLELSLCSANGHLATTKDLVVNPLMSGQQNLEQQNVNFQVPRFIAPIATTLVKSVMNLHQQAVSPSIKFTAGVYDPRSYSVGYGINIYNSLGEEFILILYFVQGLEPNIWDLHCRLGSEDNNVQNSFKLVFDDNGFLIKHDPDNSGSSDLIEVSLPASDQKIVVDLYATKNLRAYTGYGNRQNGAPRSELCDLLVEGDELKACYSYGRRLLTLGRIGLESENLPLSYTPNVLYFDSLGRVCLDPVICSSSLDLEVRDSLYVKVMGELAPLADKSWPNDEVIDSFALISALTVEAAESDIEKFNQRYKQSSNDLRQLMSFTPMAMAMAKNITYKDPVELSQAQYALLRDKHSSWHKNLMIHCNKYCSTDDLDEQQDLANQLKAVVNEIQITCSQCLALQDQSQANEQGTEDQFAHIAFSSALQKLNTVAVTKAVEHAAVQQEKLPLVDSPRVPM